MKEKGGSDPDAIIIPICMMHFFHPAIFFPTYTQCSLFPQIPGHHPPLFSPISTNTAQIKPLTYPSTQGWHTLNSAVRFMTYPKF